MGGFGLVDLAGGLGSNAAWDLIKAAYRKTKQELDRRIDPTKEEFAFDALDGLVGEALAALSEDGKSGFTKFSSEIRAWLINLPGRFRRDTVCQWLGHADTKANIKLLITKLLVGEDVETERHVLVRAFCAWTGDTPVDADLSVEIVVRFVGETLYGRITEGDRVVIATTQRVHERIALMEERITQRLNELQPTTSRDDIQILRVFKLGQRIEKFLKTQFSAQGSGLGDLFRNSSSRVKALDPNLAAAIERFAPIRNRLAHTENPEVDHNDVDRLIEDLEQRLERQINSDIAALSLPLRPRQAIVCASGLADFRTISEAIAQAAPGDCIYVQPGTYLESISIDVPISLIGRGEAPQDVMVTNDDDDALVIGASDVVLSGLFFRSSQPHAVACVVLPGGENIQFSSCHFSSEAGEGLVGLHGTEFVATDCEFSCCKVASRVDAIGTLTGASFSSCDHGVLIRQGASGAVSQSTFRENGISVEIQDGGTAQIHANQFEAGTYGIVAVGTAKGRVFGNTFSGFGDGAAVVKLDGADALIVEV